MVKPAPYFQTVEAPGAHPKAENVRCGLDVGAVQCSRVAGPAWWGIPDSSTDTCGREAPRRQVGS